MTIDITDLNWDEITRDSSTEDLIYIKGKIDQRLSKTPRRKISISSEGVKLFY
jgi:hypothetical protein